MMTSTTSTAEVAKMDFDAFFAATVSESDTAPELREIPWEDIDANAGNFYSVDDVEELKNSIEMHGLLDPIVVMPGEDGRYTLISGHRRHKAWGQLREEDPERWARIPAIVRSFPSPRMAELALIMANSASRKLTPAEIGKQAQRIEQLLYDLKEEGYSFPGRMREQVAKACQVSSTKLARLKAIENHLTGIWLTIFEKNGIAEETAYQLSRLSPEIQTKIMRATERPGAYGVEIVGKMMTAEGVTYDGSQLKLPGCRKCTHGDAFLRHDLDDPYSPCQGKTCCLSCSKATRDWNPCPRMCAAAKKVRSEKAQAEKAEEAKKQKRKENRIRQELRESARRLLAAAEAAGIADDVEIKSSGGWRTWNVDFLRRAAGDGDVGSIYENHLAPEKLDVAQTAKALSCSADYVCGLTDELRPTAVSESDTGAPRWMLGEPPADGRYICGLQMGSSLIEQTVDRRDGAWYIIGQPVETYGEVKCWWPLPRFKPAERDLRETTKDEEEEDDAEI